MWKELHRICKDNGAIVLFGSEPFSSALRMSNIKNYQNDWVWVKSRKTGFANCNHQPMRNVENVVIFSKGKANPNGSLKMKYYPQGIKSINKKYKRNVNKNTVNNGEKDGSLSGEVVQKFTGYPSQVLDFKSENKTTHPTQKPVALMEYLIKTYTNGGETVLDFTMGSGTTGVASKNLDRKFIGIEQDEKYFEIAKERINNTPTPE